MKFDNNSELLVAEVIGESLDRQGKVVKQFRWIKVDKSISLGSMVNPNKKIVQFKYTPIQRQNPLGDMFKGMFK